MSDKEIWNTLVHVMRDTFDDDQLDVAPEMTARDVDGWDSLAHIELVVALESAFDVRFNTGEIAGLKNVGDLARAIETRVGRGPR